MRKISSCRNCKNKKLENLFSLGSLSFTGKFTKKKVTNIPKDEIKLIKCKKCNLVQLSKNFNPSYLYGKDYGYRSGINKTMTEHLSSISKKMTKLANLKKNDHVLDIASNDATLLNSYKKKDIITVGVDPILNKYKRFYKNINFKISSLFSQEIIYKKKIYKKFKIITACAVFYDMHDPNKFLKEISNLIDPKLGIFYLEFQDLLSIIKKNLFDTICHEHIEYYSLNVVKKMLKQNNLKLINVQKNNINGGSLSLFISHNNGRYNANNSKINRFIKEENKYNLNDKKTFLKFYKKINQIKKNLNELILNLLKKGNKIHGYGASTKGNVLLQYFELTKKHIPYIADRNPDKSNLFTPGTKIKIINEKQSRSLAPHYYLVLPSQFKKEILIREKEIRTKGTKFIFPLPKLKVI